MTKLTAQDILIANGRSINDGDFQEVLAQLHDLIDAEVIGPDYDLSKIPFGPAQIEATVANHLKAEQRQALKRIMGDMG